MKLGKYEVELGPDGGLLIRPEGMGDYYSNPGNGHPILIRDDTVYVWGDINEEDPTASIDISGALELSRGATKSEGGQ